MMSQPSLEAGQKSIISTFAFSLRGSSRYVTAPLGIGDSGYIHTHLPGIPEIRLRVYLYPLVFFGSRSVSCVGISLEYRLPL